MKKFVGITFFLTVFVLISLVVIPKVNSARQRDKLCDAFSANQPIRLENVANIANELGVRTISIVGDLSVPVDSKTTDGLYLSFSKWGIPDSQRMDKAKLSELDSKLKSGEINAVIGFPTHYTCTIKFSTGIVTSVEKSSFD